MANSNRPASFYDNFDSARFSAQDMSTRTPDKKEENPSQALCMTTTVPQNIAARSIAGKHTPTRQSLRHSRMIVLNRNGRVPTKYLPPIIRYDRWAKCLVGLLIILGIALCFMAVWLLIWTPNLDKKNNLYWSAVPVLLSGILGLVFLCCCPKAYPGRKLGYCVHSFKYLSISTSIIAVATALTVCTFTTLHLIALKTMICTPPDKLNSTCVCRTPSISNTTDTETEEETSYRYHYVDLSCPEVHNVLSLVLIFACSVNLIAIVLELIYLYLHWVSRRRSYTYSRVKVDEPNVLER